MGQLGPEPRAVVSAFGLPGSVAEWREVGGAWSNRVFRLATSEGVFAVKQMRNPWLIERWAEWLDEAWKFELRAIAAGVPAPVPVANPLTGGCLAWVPAVGAESVPVRVHQWADAVPLGSGVVTAETARWAGRILATLHGLRIQPEDRSLFPIPDATTAGRWPELTDAARRAKAPWAGLVTAAAPSAALIADLTQSAGFRPAEEVMSHGDVDQKNMLGTELGPILCDWDVASPVVPRRELADAALSMGCWRDFAIAREVIASYRASGGDDRDFEPDDLGQPLATGLDWVAMNIDRVLGLRPASAAEIAQAGQLLPGLLTALPRDVETAQRITELLRI
jgi:aminoglycoside phosphotransferase (APT) family kinase protein